MPRPTTSPAQPSPFSPFDKGVKRRRRPRVQYGPLGFHAGMVGPFPNTPRVSGLDTDSMLTWAKDNKWYLLGGALLLGAAVAVLKK